MLNSTLVLSILLSCALVPSLAQAQDNSPSAVAVLFAFEDLKGEPVALNYTSPFVPSSEQCLIIGSATTLMYTCVPSQLRSLKVDGAPVEANKSFSLTFPPNGVHVTWFQLTAGPGEHVVNFPEQLTLYPHDDIKQYFVMDPEQTINFRDGAIVTIRLRPESHVGIVWERSYEEPGYFALIRGQEKIKLEKPRVEGKSVASIAITPDEYKLVWVNGEEASIDCPIERDMGVSKALSDDILCRDPKTNKPYKVCHCYPGEKIVVSVIDGVLTRKKVGSPFGNSPPDIDVFHRGVRIRVGDSVTVKPGEDVEIKFTTWPPKEEETVQNGR